MASWPESPRLIGTEIPRLDGLAKASGRAKYPSDEAPKEFLIGAILWSPHAHARITSLDAKKAEAMPGVKGVFLAAEEGTTLRYQGETIAAVAAETEEQARDAARAIEVEYEVLPVLATEAQAMAEGAPENFKGGNVRRARTTVDGDPEAALKDADVRIEATYSAPVITHVCLEPHGLTARWDAEDRLTVWASTQNVMGVAGELAQRFEIPVANVTVLTEVMGGGFGSKFPADIWGIAAAELAKKAGRPVRMFLDRAQEHMAGGNRPSVTGKITAGAKKDGTITAIVAETWGTGGVAGGSQVIVPYVYSVKNASRTHAEVFINAGGSRAMRAPRHPQSCILTESAVDDLADTLGIDPLEMRLKNLAEKDPLAGGKLNRSDIYREQIRIGAEKIGWKDRKPRGESGKGPVKRGLGMALHQWGGGGAPDKQVTCLINPDGSVEVRTATQDIGTGARTILAVIAAELLGLDVKDIRSNIGNSTFPPGQASGGSTTTPSMSPPCFAAVTAARDALFARIAPGLDARPEDLALKDGKVLVKGEAKMSWKDACRKLGMMPISETGKFDRTLADVGVGGCQFVDLTVDCETGVVRLKKIVAVQDTGLILDMLTWRSQVYGGVIMGLNYGLFEERVLDPTTGVQLNADMELYKLAGPTDIPEIEVVAHDTPEMRARGVIGVGEPPTIATAAAIGNAVTNAIGVRVPQWPMNPMNILNALASKGA